MKKLARSGLLALLVVGVVSCHGDAQRNDTGGIIMWTPDAGKVYRDLAYLHCAQYNKVAVITSVHRRYGDYAGFRCYFQRDYDPRKAYLYNGF